MVIFKPIIASAIGSSIVRKKRYKKIPWWIRKEEHKKRQIIKSFDKKYMNYMKRELNRSRGEQRKDVVMAISRFKSLH